MNVILLDGPNAGTVTSVGDDVTSIGPIGGGTYVRSGTTDALGRVEFRWVENQNPNPQVKALVNDNPPPLNPERPFPYKIDSLPAAALFGVPFASIATREEPRDPAANPNRKETR